MERTQELIRRFYGFDFGTIGAEAIETEYKREELETLYSRLGASQGDNLILKALCVMTWLLADEGPLGRASIEKAMTEKLITRETLKLLVFSRENRKSDTITVSSSTGKIKFANYGNWLMERLLDPFFRKEGLNGLSTASARAMLHNTRKKAGRTASDPRIQPLLLGTYELISESRSFATPMPDKLCEFLLDLLTFWRVLPENPVIDPMWIRAQLRYLKKRPERPKLPIPNLD